MGIKDIPLSNIPTPAPGVPLPPTMETIIQTAKGSISTDPQSGSILQVLASNGFQEKIQDGYRQGKTYTVLHAAPSTDFTLIESWDDQGTPRKNYQFFKIVSDTPAPETPILAAPIKTEEVHEIIVQPKELEAPVAKTEPGRAEEVAQKIKRGGAGMTPEDWDYRNKNWPEIEKFLMGPTPQSSAVADASSPYKGEPLSEETSAPKGKIIAPTTQHYESKNWLVDRLGASSPGRLTPSTLSTSVERIKEQGVSSYDLLKAKFAQGAPSAPKTPEAPAASPAERKNIFLDSIFKDAPNEWELTKAIPARAFIYPTEYAWGTDDTGSPVNHSLEDYPIHARTLREKISQSVEDAAMKGVNIETSTVDQVLTSIFEKGLM